MEVKLRVCPFCGGKAELIDESEDWYAEYSMDSEWVNLPMWIQCTQCYAQISASEYDAKEDIIMKWNARDILDIAANVNDDQIYTQQERADLLFEVIDKYNKYED